MSRGPVLIDLDQEDVAQPALAPTVPDVAAAPQGAAMQQVAALAARRPSRLARWFWSLALTLTGFVVSLAAWDYVTSLLVRSPVLGGIATALVGLLIVILVLIGLRELAAFSRLRRLDTVQRQATAALEANDLTAARGVVAALGRLYADRDDTAWGRAELKSRQSDV